MAEKFNGELARRGGLVEPVVTRFAPSPTGYLHVGGARTALFCWLMAKHTGGTMILRIEDTDQKRNTPAATQQVIDDLRWLGIEWDEGPEVDGPNGPYFQSQRLDIYQKYTQKLLDADLAYYCFDTPEELEATRKESQAKKENFLYRRPEKLPDEKDVEKARAEGRPVVIRFCMPNEEIIVNDIVRGEVKFPAGEFGDFIICKSDGYPTYHFACVVDDMLMKITHVIRGQEHLMNTPCHIALQKALGFRTPNYVHMSVTISEGGGKLSKRERGKTLVKAIKQIPNADLEKIASVGGITSDELNDFLNGKSQIEQEIISAIADYLGVHLPEINVVDFFESGYLPEAMVNFIALLGWSSGGKKEIMTKDELIEAFDLARLTKTNSLFDRDKLLAFNTEHMKLVDKETLLGHFKKYLAVIDSPIQKADDDMLKRILQINEGAKTLEMVEHKSRFLFLDNDKIEYDEKAVQKVLLKDNGLAMLQIIRDRLDAMGELSEKAVEDMLRGLAEEKQVGLGKVAQPLRVAICGNTISPPIFDSIQLLGKENTLIRIDNTLQKFAAENAKNAEK
ncbi:MAG: glutamate--tRNA ligase [Sedimentisphaerales bacterium]|nr:glutamate--tRNA ligase [Sedimentisphaerales bacterium]